MRRIQENLLGTVGTVLFLAAGAAPVRSDTGPHKPFGIERLSALDNLAVDRLARSSAEIPAHSRLPAIRIERAGLHRAGSGFRALHGSRVHTRQNL